MAKKKADPPPVDPKEARINEIVSLSHRAQNGDAAALDRLRDMFHGAGILWEKAGDLAAQIVEGYGERMTAKNLLVQDAVKRRYQAMRAEMAGPDPTPLESLLADRIAVCWVALQEAEISYARSDNLPLYQAAFAQKRISAAQARYLAAIKALAQVRRLAVPVVQVNVAQAGARQLNVAAPGPVMDDAPGEDG